MAHHKRRTPRRGRTPKREFKRPLRHRLRRLRNASDCKRNGTSDNFRSWYFDGFKGLAR